MGGGELSADRIEAMDIRLRAVESCVIELGVLVRYMKYAVLIFAATVGYDLSAVVL